LPVSEPVDNLSAATNLYNILRVIPCRHNPDLFVGDIFKKLIEENDFKTSDNVSHFCSAVLSAVGVCKMPLGMLDSSVSISSDVAKTNLARMQKKDRCYLVKDTLLSKLLQYKFNFEFTSDASDEPMDRATWEQVSDGYSWSVIVRHGDDSLKFESSGDIGGDIKKFIDGWNSTLLNDQMEYVELTDEYVSMMRSLLRVFDICAIEKSWNSGRAPCIVSNLSFQQIDNSLFQVADDFMKLVAKNMNSHLYSSHYADNYTSYLVAGSRIDKGCYPSTAFFSKVNLAFMRLASSKILAARNQFKFAMSDVAIAQVFSDVVAARNNRKTYRNKGFREVLSKVMMDPLYPFAPNALSTARKFQDIMCKNKELYDMEANVYGCARMHFSEALTKGITSENHDAWLAGKRNFYDIKTDYCNSNMGYNVQHGDYYAQGVGSAVGKGLIDDVNGSINIEVKVDYKVGPLTVPVLFKKDCVSHKIRVAEAAGYEAGCIKMMVERFKDYSPGDPMKGGGWMAPLSRYTKVSFDSPGKMQSGEFYIYFSGRTDTYDPMRMRLYLSQWAAFFRRKCSVAALANAFMDAGTFRDARDVRKSLFSLSLLNASLPESLQNADPAKDPRGVMRNALVLQPRDVGVISYVGYSVIGKKHLQATAEERESINIDLFNL